MKKIALILAIIISLAYTGTGVACAEVKEYTSSDLKYILLEDGTAEITGRTENGQLLMIPGALDGHPVSSIAPSAFSSDYNLRTVYFMEDGVETIGAYAFLTCYNLKEIYLPNTLVTIEDSAFWGCDALEAMILPYSVETIGDFAFANCGSMVVAYIQGNTENIGNKVFQNCDRVTLVLDRGSYGETYAKFNGLPYVFYDELQ